MPSYDNPESIKPPYGWQPQGALAGMWSMRDRNRYDSQASLVDLMRMLEAAKQQEEYTQGMPVRAAERGKKITDADLATIVNRAKMQQPGYGPAMARGPMGEAAQQEAAGNLAIGTASGRIESTNLENRGKSLEQTILQQRLRESTNPFDTLVQNPAHQRAMELEREKQRGHQQGIETQANAHIKGIREQSSALLKRAEISKEDKSKIKKLEQEATEIITNARKEKRLLNPQEQQQIQLIYQFLGGIRQPYGMAPYQYMGQTPVQQPPLQFPSPDSQPKSKYERGKVYQFKQGNYIYQGGPEDIAASWKKVD